MFWFRKKDKKTPPKPSRAEIIAQAQANARKARAEIGEEAIKKIAESFVEEQRRKEQAGRQGRIDKARHDIRAMDKDKVADRIRSMIKDKE
jgi:hypothetical protein